jgi:hypothetical protein
MYARKRIAMHGSRDHYVRARGRVLFSERSDRRLGRREFTAWSHPPERKMEHYAPMDTSPANGIGMERGGANRGPMTEPDVNKHYPAAVAGAHTAGSARPLG